jgi:hypothetical protein
MKVLRAAFVTVVLLICMDVASARAWDVDPTTDVVALDDVAATCAAGDRDAALAELSDEIDAMLQLRNDFVESQPTTTTSHRAILMLTANIAIAMNLRCQIEEG